jgi:hypothetical protein
MQYANKQRCYAIGYRERTGKHIPAATNAHEAIEEPVSKQQIGKHITIGVVGGGVEYLRRNPSSRRTCLGV